MLKDADQRWNVSEAAELYEVPRWGQGYVSIHRNGNLMIHPERNPLLNGFSTV